MRRTICLILFTTSLTLSASLAPAQPLGDELVEWCDQNPSLCAGLSTYMIELISRQSFVTGSDILRPLLESAEAAVARGNHIEIIKKVREAITLVNLIGARGLEVDILTGIGQIYFSLRQYERALDFHFRALERAQGLKDVKSINFNLIRIAEVYLEIGQHEKGKTFIEQALFFERERIYKENLNDTQNRLPHLTAQLEQFQNQGIIHEQQGHYDKAIEYYNSHSHVINNLTYGQSLLDMNLSLNYWRIKSYEKSIELYLKTLDNNPEYIQNDQFYRSLILMVAGVLYNELEQYDKALMYHTSALSLIEGSRNYFTIIYVLDKIASTYHNMGQYRNAIKFYQRILEVEKNINIKSIRAIALTNIAHVQIKTGQYQEAYFHLSKSTMLHNQFGLALKPWRAQHGLAALEVAFQRPIQAIPHYQAALNSIESLREGLDEKSEKLSFFSDKLFIYDELIQLFQKQYENSKNDEDKRQSLEIFERKQGRIFLEQMGRSGARRFSGLPDSIRNQEIELAQNIKNAEIHIHYERSKPVTQHDREQIKSLDENLTQLKIRQEAFQKQLRDKYPAYYALKYPYPATLAELQKEVLKHDEMMLAYSVMEQSAVLWVIAPNLFQMYQLPIDKQTLSQNVTNLRRAIQRKSNFIGLAKSAHELYQLLIPEPVRPLLNGKQVYIIPTGPLYKLPFETLVTHMEPNSSTVRYLIETASVSYLSSASLLKIIREAERRRDRSTALEPLLAFANPIYTNNQPAHAQNSIPFNQKAAIGLYLRNSNLRSMPETEDEAREIKAILEAPDKSAVGIETLQLKDNATKQNVLDFNRQQALDDYRYLLFAMHGLLKQIDHFTQPVLAFSYPHQQGYLTMAETVAGILRSVWTGRPFPFILPVQPFLRRANHVVRTRRVCARPHRRDHRRQRPSRASDRGL